MSLMGECIKKIHYICVMECYLVTKKEKEQGNPVISHHMDEDIMLNERYQSHEDKYYMTPLT